MKIVGKECPSAWRSNSAKICTWVAIWALYSSLIQGKVLEMVDGNSNEEVSRSQVSHRHCSKGEVCAHCTLKEDCMHIVP
jgi:hypothetical protein